MTRFSRMRRRDRSHSRTWLRGNFISCLIDADKLTQTMRLHLEPRGHDPFGNTPGGDGIDEEEKLLAVDRDVPGFWIGPMGTTCELMF